MLCMQVRAVAAHALAKTASLLSFMIADMLPGILCREVKAQPETMAGPDFWPFTGQITPLAASAFACFKLLVIFEINQPFRMTVVINNYETAYTTTTDDC